MSSQPRDSPLATVTAWVEQGRRFNSRALLNFASEDHFLLDAFPSSRGYSNLSLATPSHLMLLARMDAEDQHETARIVDIFEANNGRTVVAHVRCDSVMTAGNPSVTEFIYVIDLVLVGESWKFGHVVAFKFSDV